MNDLSSANKKCIHNQYAIECYLKKNIQEFRIKK